VSFAGGSADGGVRRGAFVALRQLVGGAEGLHGRRLVRAIIAGLDALQIVCHHTPPLKLTELGMTLAPAAYGFRLSGVAGRYLQKGEDPTRPLLTVRMVVHDGQRRARSRPAGGLTLPLVDGGRLVLDRSTLTATYEVPAPLDGDDLAHPFLAPAASVMAGWQGWDAFHAGAFARDGRAVAVLGPRGQGKSTLLAAMALRGVAVLADDVLVLEQGVAHVGPRCIDLRPEGVERAFPAAPLEPSRGGERLRLALTPIASAPELVGWVSLDWGERLELEPLRPSQRLRRLALAHSRAGRPRDEALLELARLPGWELLRPRRLELLGKTSALLVELAGA
jgi:hypothetical protein